MHKTKGFTALLITGFLYALFGILVRYLGREVNSFQLLTLTALSALIILIGIFIIRRTKISFKGIPIKYLLLYGFSYGFSALSYNISAAETKLSSTVFLLYLGSFTTTLIVGQVLYKEKLSVKKVLSFGLALLGLTIFTYPFSFAQLTIGVIFGLCAGIGDGLTNTASKYVSGKADEFALVLLRIFGALLIGAIALTYLNQLYIPHISVFAVFITVLFGLVIIFSAYTALAGFSNFDLNLGTIIVSSELIFATVMAAFLFSEYPTLAEAIGGFFIFAAIVVSHFEFKK